MDDLEHVMGRIGRVLTADAALDVKVRGDRAYAEPGRIVLPSIESFASALGDQAERLMHGLVDHEIGHALDTDFDALEAVGRMGPPELRELAGVFEDAYVEGRRGALMQGSRYNLAFKNQWFLPKALDIVRDPELPMLHRVMVALCYVSRPYGGVAVEELGAADVEAVIEDLRPELDRLPALYPEPRQTAEAIAISRAAWEKVKHLRDDPEEEEDEDEGDNGGGASDEGEDEDEGASGEPPPTNEPAEAPQAQGGEAPTAQAEDTPQPAPTNPEEAINEALRAPLEEPDNGRPYTVFDPTFDVARDFSSELTDNLSNAYEKYRQEALGVVDDLVLAFEHALKSRTQKRLTVSDEEAGEIDVEALGTYAVGATGCEDLWLDYKGEIEGGYAAVGMLIDCSGSMAWSSGSPLEAALGNANGPGSKAHLARLCAIAFHEAMLRCQIPHEVSGFTTLDSDLVDVHPWTQNLRGFFEDHFARLRMACLDAQRRGVDLTTFARTCWGDAATAMLRVPIHGIFKSFEQGDGRGLVLAAGVADNLDGEAVLWQGRRLACRPEHRRVLFVLSDGLPCGSFNDRQGERYLREAVQRVEAAGIEVHGIGINSDAVRGLYPRWWVCRELSDLPRLVMQTMIDTVAEQGGEQGGGRWREELLR
jgi:hypothetical protein